jgi:hypothetical protein
MPGDFIQEVLIYRCGTQPDGTAIMCSDIHWAKDLFPESGFAEGVIKSEDSPSLGWQHADDTAIHIPLKRLVAAMKEVGITVSYDEDELARRMGPPESAAY